MKKILVFVTVLMVLVGGSLVLFSDKQAMARLVYYYSSLVNPSPISLERLTIKLPKHWWLQSRDSDAIMLARISKGSERGFILVGFYSHIDEKMVRDVNQLKAAYKIPEYKLDGHEGYLLKRTSQSTTEVETFDTIWIFPDLDIMITSSRVTSEDFLNIEKLILEWVKVSP